MPIIQHQAESTRMDYLFKNEIKLIKLDQFTIDFVRHVVGRTGWYGLSTGVPWEGWCARAATHNALKGLGCNFFDE